MTKISEHYDFLVIGTGIFGSYAALHFSNKGFRVLLIDIENEPWKKASIVNQARVHSGYHYPRSVSTGLLSNNYRKRFEVEHANFINKKFDKYYGIDNHGSLTSADQFMRYCDFIDIPYIETSRPDLFHEKRLEALFKTTEYSFDPFLIRSFYLDRLNESNVELSLATKVIKAMDDDNRWAVELKEKGEEKRLITAGNVLNATYANINAVNRIFSINEIDITYELSEIVILKSNRLSDVGLTVMDGPYISIMPYGRSSFHSLSSVLYTHHLMSTKKDPEFKCQEHNTECSAQSLRICTSCKQRPTSNLNKMIQQARLYINDNVDVLPHGSLFTVKAKLRSTYIDDARPTDIRVGKTSPFFAYVFSGKINSIYEVERLLDVTQ